MLVDTNVWSEASRSNGKASVVQWIADNRRDLWLSTIVLAELQAGIENPAAVHKRAGLEQWLARLEAANMSRTLMFDRLAAHTLGKLLVAKPQDAKLLDTLIAAQALSRDCPIATRNVRDFEWTGAKLIDPWAV